MQGFVTTRHLVTHGPVIVRQFGWRIFFVCVARATLLRYRGPATFLSVVRDCGRRTPRD